MYFLSVSRLQSSAACSFANGQHTYNTAVKWNELAEIQVLIQGQWYIFWQYFLTGMSPCDFFLNVWYGKTTEKIIKVPLGKNKVRGTYKNKQNFSQMPNSC